MSSSFFPMRYRDCLRSEEIISRKPGSFKPFQLVLVPFLGQDMLEDYNGRNTKRLKNPVSIDATINTTKNPEMLLYTIVVRDVDGHGIPLVQLLTDSKSASTSLATVEAAIQNWEIVQGQLEKTLDLLDAASAEVKEQQTEIVRLNDLLAASPRDQQAPKAEKSILITALEQACLGPRIGALTALSADVFARFSKARDNNTLFVCCMDEQDMRKIPEQNSEAFCDQSYHLLAEVYDFFEIRYDEFSRTTTEKRTEIREDIFRKMDRNGNVTVRSSPEWYDKTHQKSLSPDAVLRVCSNCGYKDARGGKCDTCGCRLVHTNLNEPRSPLGGKVILRYLDQTFLDLEKLQKATKLWANGSSLKGKWSAKLLAITGTWLNNRFSKPLLLHKSSTPLASQDKASQAFQEWFELLISYISATAQHTNEWQQWWQNPKNVELHQFVGNYVGLHTTIFPACLIATGQNWTKLHRLYSIEESPKEGGISCLYAKSTGISASVWRYYLLSNRSETVDSHFSWIDLRTKNNSDLLDNLGSFVALVIAFTNDNYDGKVPEYSGMAELGLFDQKKLSSEVNLCLKSYIEALEAGKQREALACLIQISTWGKEFVKSNELNLGLLERSPEVCAAIVNLALNLIYLISALAWPYMPSTSESIAKQLNVQLPKIADLWTFGIWPGHKIGKSEPLFELITPKKATELEVRCWQ